MNYNLRPLTTLLPILVSILVLFGPHQAIAQEILFSDDFTGGPSSGWIDVNDSWLWQDGTYVAQNNCGVQACQNILYHQVDTQLEMTYSFTFVPEGYSLVRALVATDAPTLPELGDIHGYFFSFGGDGKEAWVQRSDGWNESGNIVYEDILLEADPNFDLVAGQPYRMTIDIGPVTMTMTLEDLTTGASYSHSVDDPTYRGSYYGVSTNKTTGPLDDVLVTAPFGPVAIEPLRMGQFKLRY